MGEGGSQINQDRWAHRQKRPNKGDTDKQREKTPRKTRNSQRRNPRIKWGHHTQKETREEGETGQKRLRDLGGRG